MDPSTPPSGTGGEKPFPEPGQPYPGQQPDAGQPYPGQSPYAGQQPYAGQPPYPGQQPYAGQPYPGQQSYPVQQGYPGAQYPAVPPGPLTHLPDGAPLASVWKRLGAAVLDSIFVSLLATPVYGVAFLIGTAMIGGSSYVASQSGDSGALMGGLGLGATLLMTLVMTVGMLAIVWFYYVARVRKVGATFGKQLLGLRIRSVRLDGQLTYGQIFARWLAVSFVSGLTGGLLGILDVLWCLWDPLRQCLHDKVAGTVVTDDQAEWLPPSHPEVLRARASVIPKGWLADGPVPYTPPGYPRHPGAGTYLGA